MDGGTSLSILFGYPKVFTSERCHKKLLATQGIAYDTNSGHVVACSSQVTHFVTSNGKKFVIFPGSALAKKAGKWIMAAEITETS